ncbi:hypothetical protein MASR2M79_03020 [Aminivibrio sp.]
MRGTEQAPLREPIKTLRYVTAIYPMPAHILVNLNADIKTIADFKGKKIDFGSVGQGIEVNAGAHVRLWSQG